MAAAAWWLLLGALASGVLSGCGTATTAEPEELQDLGPRDAESNRVLAFDGVDDYVSVGTARAPQIMREQSLTLWFKAEASPTGAGGERQVLFTLRRSDWSGIALALEQGVPLAYNVFGPRDLARAVAPIGVGEWHHLAFVIDASGSRLYLDGSALATESDGATPLTNRTPTQAFIGSLDGFSLFFHGELDSVRVYPRALPPSDVAAVSAGRTPGEPEALVLDLPFDEASGARAYDRSGLGNHASLGDGVPQLMPTRSSASVP